MSMKYMMVRMCVCVVFGMVYLLGGLPERETELIIYALFGGKRFGVEK